MLDSLCFAAALYLRQYWTQACEAGDSCIYQQSKRDTCKDKQYANQNNPAHFLFAAALISCILTRVIISSIARISFFHNTSMGRIHN